MWQDEYVGFLIKLPESGIITGLRYMQLDRSLFYKRVDRAKVTLENERWYFLEKSVAVVIILQKLLSITNV